MASTPSPSLPLTKLESPLLSSQTQRRNRINGTLSMLSSPIHLSHNNFKVSQKSSKLSSLKSNGLFVYSFAKDYSVSNNQIEAKKSVSNDTANEPQVQSRYEWLQIFFFFFLIFINLWNFLNLFWFCACCWDNFLEMEFKICHAPFGYKGDNFMKLLVSNDDFFCILFLCFNGNTLCCSMWNWKGYSIRHQYSGNSGPALVLVHGFGANRSTLLTFCFSLAGN